MNSTTKASLKYQILFVIGIIAISFSSIFIRWSDAEASVIGMYRLFLTNLIMLPLVWKSRKEMFSLTGRQWGWLLLSGTLLGLHFLFWIGSLSYTTVASSTVILTLEPILVVIASYFLFGTRINRTMMLGIGLALVGSIVIGAGDFQVSGSALHGDLLSLLGTVAVAAHMLAGKQILQSMSAFVYNFWVFFTAASLLAVYNLVQGYAFTGYSSKEWGVFLLLAVVPTLFGHYLFNWLMQYMSASAVSMAVLGEPVVASLLAWSLLKESLSGLQLGAGAVILAGVWLFIANNKEVPKPAAEPERRRKSA
ncbi:multidrug transporter [Paenibacillus antibioticophila]|uniref:Multidrug transporter n=1 Tax=Paenibacillus antibioticophila TaxID=1274374 RepID=A0A919XS99_9BACL|nr:DMT family transporter [Paenibacillus antibioticophila]GIO36623.1 multidrug transporter [Paenibacillus antibioticophila]